MGVLTRINKYAMYSQGATVEVLPSCTTGWIHTGKGTTSFTLAADSTLTYDNPEALHTLTHSVIRSRLQRAYRYYGHTDEALTRRIGGIHK